MNIDICMSIKFLCEEAMLLANNTIIELNTTKEKRYAWQIERISHYVNAIKTLAEEIK